MSQWGQSTTHIDALCHVWDEKGMWDGKDAKETLKFDGARYGSVDAWKEGIITRRGAAGQRAAASDHRQVTAA